MERQSHRDALTPERFPPIETVRACFHEPFGEGSSYTPRDLTPTSHLLNEVMRRTLLSRMGYHEGLAHIQLWLVSHLVSQIEFDIWDVILSEMEDTIAEGFKGLAPICSLDLLPPL
jgi:hypothetical protein